MIYIIERARRWIEWRKAEWKLTKAVIRMSKLPKSPGEDDSILSDFDEKLYIATLKQCQYTYTSKQNILIRRRNDDTE